MEPDAFVEMRVSHIQDHPLTYPLVFFRTTTGTRYFLLPIPLHMSETISNRLEDRTDSCPQPHDLLLHLLTVTGGHIQRVLIHETTQPVTPEANVWVLQQGEHYLIAAQPRHIQRVLLLENTQPVAPDSGEDVFMAQATVELHQHGQLYQVEAQPSDAVALALRIGAPIFMTQALLDRMIQHDEDYYDPSPEAARPTKSSLLKVLAPVLEVFAFQTLDKQYSQLPLEQQRRFAWEDHLHTSAGLWEGQPVHGLKLARKDEQGWLLLSPEQWDILQEALDERVESNRAMNSASATDEETE